MKRTLVNLPSSISQRTTRLFKSVFTGVIGFKTSLTTSCYFLLNTNTPPEKCFLPNPMLTIPTKHVHEAHEASCSPELVIFVIGKF